MLKRLWGCESRRAKYYQTMGEGVCMHINIVLEQSIQYFTRICSQNIYQYEHYFTILKLHKHVFKKQDEFFFSVHIFDQSTF